MKSRSQIITAAIIIAFIIVALAGVVYTFFSPLDATQSYLSTDSEDAVTLLRRMETNPPDAPPEPFRHYLVTFDVTTNDPKAIEGWSSDNNYRTDFVLQEEHISVLYSESHNIICAHNFLNEADTERCESYTDTIDIMDQTADFIDEIIYDALQLFTLADAVTAIAEVEEKQGDMNILRLTYAAQDIRDVDTENEFVWDLLNDTTHTVDILFEPFGAQVVGVTEYNVDGGVIDSMTIDYLDKPEVDATEFFSQQYWEASLGI